MKKILYKFLTWNENVTHIALWYFNNNSGQHICLKIHVYITTVMLKELATHHFLQFLTESFFSPCWYREFCRTANSINQLPLAIHVIRDIFVNSLSFYNRTFPSLFRPFTISLAFNTDIFNSPYIFLFIFPAGMLIQLQLFFSSSSVYLLPILYFS